MSQESFKKICKMEDISCQTKSNMNISESGLSAHRPGSRATTPKSFVMRNQYAKSASDVPEGMQHAASAAALGQVLQT